MTPPRLRRRDLLAAGAGVLAAGPAPAAANEIRTLPAGSKLYAVDVADGAVRWSREIAVGGQPAVADGQVVRPGFEDLHAFDAATGERLWRRQGIGPGWEAAGTTERVAVSDGTVVTRGGDGGLVALDAADGGSIRWRHSLDGDDSVVPVVHGGVVYASRDASQGGELRAVDAGTGELLWTYRTEEALYDPPAVADGGLFTDGTSVFVEASEGRVTALDAASGEPHWTTPPADPTIGPVAIGAPGGDPTVVVRRGDLIEAFDPPDGGTRWTFDLDGYTQWSGRGSVDPDAGPAIHGDAVYAPNEGVSVLDAGTGRERRRLGASLGRVDDTPVVAGDRCYVAADGQFAAVSLDGERRWSVDLRRAFDGGWESSYGELDSEWWVIHSPVVVDGTAVVAADRWQVRSNPPPPRIGSSPPSAGVPGFGPLAAAGALGGAALAIARRRRGAD